MSDENFDNLPPSNGAPDLKRRARRKPGAEPSHLDRLPPHDVEAEQGVIGCCLQEPMACIPQVITKFKSEVEIVYDLRHQTILTALFRMWENNYGIDLITLQSRLSDFEQLEPIGGIAYLNQLQDGVPSAANLTYYLEIVIQKYLLRKTIRVCTDIVGRAYDHSGESNELVDQAESEILGIRKGLTSSESKGMKDLMPEVSADIERMATRSGELTGLATGFSDLDRMTGGLQPADMIVIAARPSLGKTSLAMNIAEFIVLRSKLPVGVFSLEMKDKSLMNRMVGSVSRVNMRNVREGFMADRDYPKLTSATGLLYSCPLRIDDTPSLSIMELRARARSMWQQFGIKLFVVDYLQLMRSTSKRAQENRQLEVSEISSGLKALAKELDVPVIVLSQLNRNIEQQKRKPNLSDLRESGAIEQDADLVMFLYKPKYDDDEAAEQADGIPVNLLIAKARNGPTGEVPLTFLRPYTRFESAAKVSDDDMPAESDSQQTFENAQPVPTI